MTFTSEYLDELDRHPDAYLARAFVRYARAMDAPDGPHADAEAEYATEQLALACQRLVHEIDQLPPDERPVGWSKLGPARWRDSPAVHVHIHEVTPTLAPPLSPADSLRERIRRGKAGQ